MYVLETAVGNATKEAINIILRWGSKVNHEDRPAGGYFWSTYKATCRRNGVYSNAQGPHDWNLQLSEPMMKVIASGWEKTFSRRSPAVMAGFARNATSLLQEFHRDIDSRARRVGAGIAGLHMLRQQLGVYENILKDISNTARETVNTSQKDINRGFTPVIEAAMIAAYETCVAECGPGSYMRMKAAMQGHVEEQRQVMFQESADAVRNQLNAL
ncbi:hypothetical protein MMC12_008515, partial [Toensbergia leucococca]|nr:hypothetical protein [Toensbergia leucococca]